MPVFRVPDWTHDPYDSNPIPEHPGVIWLKGRYRVVDALRYSAHGGIYRAEDTVTGDQVIIREARPYLNDSENASEPQRLLQKQAAIMQKLACTGLVPRFYDLFYEWEHLFLVEEQVDGNTLWGHMMNATFGNLNNSTAADLLNNIIKAIMLLASSLQQIHERRIVLRDMTKTNVILTSDGEHLCFIDLEFAHDLDSDDTPLFGWTPGYASPAQFQGKMAAFEDDYYALGALILDAIDVTAAGLSINRDGVLAGFVQRLHDLGLPLVLAQVVKGLLHEDPSQRWTCKQLLQVMNRPDVQISRPACDPVLLPPGKTPVFPPVDELKRADIEATIKGISRFILANMEFSREDRLWPASPEMFDTNPVSLRYGAAGVLYYLWRVSGKVPSNALDWMMKRANVDLCPPGLYIGLSGVAWFLLEIGRNEEATEVLYAINKSARVLEFPGFYNGTACPKAQAATSKGGFSLERKTGRKSQAE